MSVSVIKTDWLTFLHANAVPCFSVAQMNYSKRNRRSDGETWSVATWLTITWKINEDLWRLYWLRLNIYSIALAMQKFIRRTWSLLTGLITQYKALEAPHAPRIRGALCVPARACHSHRLQHADQIPHLSRTDLKELKCGRGSIWTGQFVRRCYHLSHTKHHLLLSRSERVSRMLIPSAASPSMKTISCIKPLSHFRPTERPRLLEESIVYTAERKNKKDESKQSESHRTEWDE